MTTLSEARIMSRFHPSRRRRGLFRVNTDDVLMLLTVLKLEHDRIFTDLHTRLARLSEVKDPELYQIGYVQSGVTELEQRLKAIEVIWKTIPLVSRPKPDVLAAFAWAEAEVASQSRVEKKYAEHGSTE